jgi:hypothetical protein
MAGRLEEYAQAIAAAQKRVEDAQLAYRRGGSLDAVNAADRALQAAHDDFYMCAGGRVRDPR